MIVKSEATPYIEAFRAGQRGAESPWLAERRQAALARFGELGFPTRRQEGWRFNDLRPLQRSPFPPGRSTIPSAVPLDPYRLRGSAHRLVIVNGRVAPERSELAGLPRGVWLASTARTLDERPELFAAAFDESDIAGAQPFAALNAAFFEDGFVLALEPGVQLDRPIEILQVSHAAASLSFHTRSLVTLGAGASARLIESFVGDGPYWTNTVSALRIAEGAVLDHVRLQDEGREAIHFAVTRASLDRGARYDGFTFTLGARLSRHDVLAQIEGEGARLGVNGAYLLKGDQEATSAVVVDHAAPGGTTRELYKGVVEDRAHGVFLGTINVRPQAQKSDARQLNNNLLLSARATVDTKPELEILADDVKCSHGATVGDLDEAALFYLRARGITASEARRMLIEAFVQDAIDAVAEPELRAHLGGHLARWLARQGG